MSTTSNINSNNLNSNSTTMKSSNVIKKFALSRQYMARTASMRRFMMSPQQPQGSFIEEALGIINSPESTTSSKESVPSRRGPVMGGRGPVRIRRGSTLCSRRARELLLDNSDQLSSLMMSSVDLDFDSDDESDLEV